MKALVLNSPTTSLELLDVPRPAPGPRQVLLRVLACAVCRTDLHIIDGELPNPRLPLIPGHEIVGNVEEVGRDVPKALLGKRLGVPWLGGACGQCRYCSKSQENLCDRPTFTGYSQNGGFAEYAVADPEFCFEIPQNYSDECAAPLLCAGLIGYRAYRMAGAVTRLGLYGFGAAAHIVCQIAVSQKVEVYAFTRRGDHSSQDFARTLGAVWAGASETIPPKELDAAIIFAPVGALIPAALAAVRKGGCVICAGIHMSDVPSFPYSLLWGERIVRSVANLTREDGREFFKLAASIPIHTKATRFRLDEGQKALDELRAGAFQGAAVLVP